MPTYVTCILCGADETELVTNKTRYNTSCTIVRCRRCGLVYMNPRPTQEEVEQFYSKDYRDLYTSSETAEQYDKKRIPTARERVKFVEKLTPKAIIDGGRILDIGCATGNFLRLMRDRGWETAGVEPDINHASYARQRGLNVLTGTMDSVDLPEHYFDTVTLFQTLEHLADPVSSLSKIKRTLKDDGLLYVEVPNVNYLKFRIINKEPADYYFQPAHVYYFSPNTLKGILEKAGFKVIYLKTRSGYAVPAERGKLARLRGYLSSPYSTVIYIVSRLDNWVRSKFGMGLYVVALAQKKLAGKD